MNIEAELPGDFDELSDAEKVEKLENLLEEIEEDSDSGKLKKRMVEELIRNYKD